MRSIRARGVWMALGLGVCAACGTGQERTDSPIALHITAPKGLLDTADSVSLTLFNGSFCNGPDKTADANSDSQVGDVHQLQRSADCPGGATQWCVKLQLPNDGTTYTWYVEGIQATQTSFRGCAVQPVDQDPETVPITVQRVVPGSKCGDGLLGATETCDPGSGGASDEACNATTCQTNEVVLANGTAANFFFAGLPQRKTGVTLDWLADGKLFGLWSDAATGPSGGDGGAEISWRRMTADLISETSPLVLMQELRLSNNGSTVGGGQKKRSGSATSPSMNPLPTGDLLVVFARQPTGSVPQVFDVVVPENMGIPAAADVLVSTSSAAQTAPDSAVDGSGNVLIVWVESNVVHGAVRKSSGSLSSSQPISTSGTASSPHVAWIGGDWVVVWSDGDDVKMRNVGSDGTPKGTETVVNATHKAGKQEAPDVAGLPTGAFVVVWQSTGSDNDDGTDIHAQRYDAAGAPQGNEVDTAIDDTNHAGDQITPAVAAGTLAGSNSFYWIAWADTTRGAIASRIMNGAGGYLYNNVNGQKDEFDVTVAQRAVSSPAVAIGGTSPGYVGVAFADDDATIVQGADDSRVKARRFPVPPPP